MSGSAFVVRAARVEARYEPRVWPWAEANRDRIAAHWTERIAQVPKLFNGRMLLIAEHGFDGETFRASYFETGYADFLAWRDFGYPDDTVVNGFAMGALQGSDGAFVLGVMGPHTANAGRIYFAAGTPDPSDLRPDGSVDLGGSVLRELHEETGLDPAPDCLSDEWIVVRDGLKISFLRPIRLAEPAEAVAARVRRHLASEVEPELAGVYIVRGPDDIDETAMPDFLKRFLRWHFGAEETR